MDIDSRHDENPIAQQRELAWKKTLAEVDGIGDSLGRGVDQGIRDTVVGCLVHGLATDASCEGHLNHGTPFPWIQIYTPELEGWQTSDAIKEGWRRSNMEQQQKVQVLLDEFYKDKSTSLELKLKCYPVGIFGGFRIQSTDIKSAQGQESKLELYQKEMNDFTVFLKGKYFT